MTAPVRTFFSLVRTKAPPLPGFTCWNSTTEKSPSGRSRLMPLRRSLVLMLMTACSLLSLDDQLFRGVGQRDRSRLGHDHRVLDADAAVLGEIDTRLDGDDVAGGQRISRGGPDRRRLVDVEPNAVAGRVLEGVHPVGLEPCEGVATDAVDLGRGHTGAPGGGAARLRLRHHVNHALERR